MNRAELTDSLLSNPDISNVKEVREVIGSLVRANLVRYQSDMKLTWHSAFILRGVGKKLINKFDAMILYEIEYAECQPSFKQ